MYSSIPYKTKQFFFLLIKLSIVTGAGYFIYHKLTNNSALSVSDLIAVITHNKILSLKNIVVLLLLSALNWLFEILKWRGLVAPVQKIAFKNALEQSLGALTASLFTPNRIGEYGAKAIYYLSSFRRRILLINLLSNMLQMSVTVLFGLIGLYFFLRSYHIQIDFYYVARGLMYALIILLLIGFGIRKNKFSVKGFSFEKIAAFIKKYPKSTFWFGFSMSVLRYLIFSFQFYLILHVFMTGLSYSEAMVAITAMYLLASVLPSVFVFDVVIKGSVAVFLFSFLGVSEIIVLSTVTIMWLANFVLPSLFGSYYILNFNLPKNE